MVRRMPGGSAGGGRWANGHRRRQLRARVRAMGLPCHICGGEIDYSLPAGHPMSFELDELVPVSRGGDPLDPSNIAPAHRICNERRGNRPVGDAKRRARHRGTRGAAVAGREETLPKVSGSGAFFGTS